MTLLAEQNTHHLHLAMMKLMKLLTLALLCGAGVAINTLRGTVVTSCQDEKDKYTQFANNNKQNKGENADEASKHAKWVTCCKAGNPSPKPAGCDCTGARFCRAP